MRKAFVIAFGRAGIGGAGGVFLVDRPASAPLQRTTFGLVVLLAHLRPRVGECRTQPEAGSLLPGQGSFQVSGCHNCPCPKGSIAMASECFALFKPLITNLSNLSDLLNEYLDHITLVFILVILIYLQC